MTSWKETLPSLPERAHQSSLLKTAASPLFRSYPVNSNFYSSITFQPCMPNSTTASNYFASGFWAPPSSLTLPLFSSSPIQLTYLWFFLQTLLLFVSSCWAYELLSFIYLFIRVWLAKTFARDLLPPREPSPPSFQSISELWTKFWLSLHFSQHHHGT